MVKQPESRLQKKIQEHLKKVFPSVFMFKVHGGPFQAAGLPDLIGCVDGLFFGLEVKLDKANSQPSEIQVATIDRINRAGGVAAVVRSPQEAEDVLNQALASSARSI